MGRSNPSSLGRGRVLRYLILLPVLSVTAPVLAHHSASMYAHATTMTLKGTVKSLDWENPHIVLWVYADHSGTEPQLWSLELSSVGNMRRLGWARDSLQPGDKVVVELNPLRDGGHGGWLQ